MLQRAKQGDDIETGLAFRPRARLLQLLGDQLIGSPRLAVFELVKNAYDADASEVIVSLNALGSVDANITIQDNGLGMTTDVLKNIWLVPGHDHKGVQRAAGVRSPKNRLPLGEKGLGRFAVHKLGNRIELVTKSRSKKECVLTLDWEQLAAHEFLEDALVEIQEREPTVFLGDATGTYLRVSDLRGEPWTRGEARRLARQITSISSPFRQKSDEFEARLEIPGREEWIDNLPDVSALLELAPWKFEFTLENNELAWRYEFNGVPGSGAVPRIAEGVERGVQIDPSDLPSASGELDPLGRKIRPKDVVTDPDFQTGIGAISGTYYIFDRDREVLDKMGENQALKSFLDEHGGVRVYRDGIRVYNYGEPSDDWLGLDMRRVNAPSKRVSRNIIVGSVDLRLSESTGLAEKTNREGFVENSAYGRFRAVVLGTVAKVEIERNIDKDVLRNLLKKNQDRSGSSFAVPLQKIRRIAVSNNLNEVLSPLLDKAESSYQDMREIMLRSGISNMTLVVVFHEIEHGVRLLHKAVEAGTSVDEILPQTRDLLGLLDGFGELLRKGSSKRNSIGSLLKRAVVLNKVRLRNHDIELVIGDSSTDLSTVYSDFPMGLVLGTITNLIDNSVYWMKVKYPERLLSTGNRRLFIGVDLSIYDGPAVIIADNGPGFQDSLEELTRPFFSRRPEGIGIGLYYVKLIMELAGGSLQMPTGEEVGVPDGFDGAVLALVFKAGK